MRHVSILLLLLAGITGQAQAQGPGFSIDACVRQNTVEVDRPFRLSVPAATEQCTTEFNQIAELEAQIVGEWVRISDGDGGTEHEAILTFLPDRTAQVYGYNFGSEQMETSFENWSFSSPGSLEGVYIYTVGVEIVGDQMEIFHMPASYPWTEVWRRQPSPSSSPAGQRFILPVAISPSASGFYDPEYLIDQGVQHLGLDLTARPGTPVLAPVTGTIVRNKTDAEDINMAILVIRPDDGSGEHVLGHVSSTLAFDDRVTAGDAIAVIREWPGNVARSHVHWGVNRNGISAAMANSRVDRWGWGKAPSTTTASEAIERGWIDLNSYLEQ